MMTLRGASEGRREQPEASVGVPRRMGLSHVARHWIVMYGKAMRCIAWMHDRLLAELTAMRQPGTTRNFDQQFV